MKELFREKDLPRIGYYQSILEDAGIPSLIRNEHAAGWLGDSLPLESMAPALCVINDEDYDRAIQVLLEHLPKPGSQRAVEQEIVCPSCTESNPGNFEVCWSCEAELPADDPPSA